MRAVINNHPVNVWAVKPKQLLQRAADLGCSIVSDFSSAVFYVAQDDLHHCQYTAQNN